MKSIFRAIARAIVFALLGSFILGAYGVVLGLIVGFIFPPWNETIIQGLGLGLLYGLVFGFLFGLLRDWLAGEWDPFILWRWLNYNKENDMNGKTVVLFLRTENAARSQMAEAFLKKYAPESFDVFSAGMEPSEVHPLTIKVMSESGIDISGQRAKGIKEFLGVLPVKVAISVCKPEEARCPTAWPGAFSRLTWPFDNPKETDGPDQEKLAKFRSVRDQIEDKIRSWIGDWRGAGLDWE